MARKWVIHYLNSLQPPLTLFQKLELCRHFGIPRIFNSDADSSVPLCPEPEWIAQSVETLLLEHDLTEITIDDACRIGLEISLTLLKGYLNLKQKCRFIAMKPPPVELVDLAPYCINHVKNCVDPW
jgi:hypothetical protein